MIAAEWIGYAAATLTTISFAPQVWQICKTKHTKDISLRMYLLFTSGVAMWLIYGLILGVWPVVAANCVTLVLAGAVLILKLRHG